VACPISTGAGSVSGRGARPAGPRGPQGARPTPAAPAPHLSRAPAARAHLCDLDSILAKGVLSLRDVLSLRGALSLSGGGGLWRLAAPHEARHGAGHGAGTLAHEATTRPRSWRISCGGRIETYGRGRGRGVMYVITTTVNLGNMKTQRFVLDRERGLTVRTRVGLRLCRGCVKPTLAMAPATPTCPVSTGGGTRLVRLVRGRAGGLGHGACHADQHFVHWQSADERRSQPLNQSNR